MFLRCAVKCAVTLLLRPCRGGATRLIERLANNLDLGMLIPHCSFHILVPHREHYCLQVAGLFQDSSAVVMPATIEDQLFRKASFFSGLPKAIRHRGEMTCPRTLRGKYPSLTPACANVRGAGLVLGRLSAQSAFRQEFCYREQRRVDCSNRHSRCASGKALFRSAFPYLALK